MGDTHHRGNKINRKQNILPLLVNPAPREIFRKCNPYPPPNGLEVRDFEHRGVSYAVLVDQVQHERWWKEDEFDPNFSGRSPMHEYDTLNLEETGRGVPNSMTWATLTKPHPQLTYWEEASERRWNANEKKWEKAPWFPS